MNTSADSQQWGTDSAGARSRSPSLAAASGYPSILSSLPPPPISIPVPAPIPSLSPSSTVSTSLSHARPRNPPTRAPVHSLSGSASTSSRASSSFFAPTSSSATSHSVAARSYSHSYAESAESSMDWNSGPGSIIGEGDADLAGMEGGGEDNGLEELEEGGRGKTKSKIGFRRALVGAGAGLGLGIAGLGANEEQDEEVVDPEADLQLGLEELARYAQSLPSPLPPLSPDDERTMVYRVPGEVGETDSTFSVQQQGGATSNWPPSGFEPNRNREQVQLQIQQQGSLQPRQSTFPSFSSLTSISTSTSTSTSSRPPISGSVSAPGSFSLAYPSTFSVSNNNISQFSALDVSLDSLSEADGDFSVSEQSGIEDYTPSDAEDDGGLRSGFSSRFASRSDIESPLSARDRGRMGGRLAVGTGAGVGWRTEDDEEVLRGSPVSPTQVVLDRSGMEVMDLQVSPSTTHLILARTTSPAAIPGLLRRVVPSLAFGLVVLDISYCRLTELPVCIAKLASLQELDIKGNSLFPAFLPSFLSSLHSLRVLIADSCGIVDLPHSLASLDHLHTISIRYNSFRALPSWLSRLPRLETLLVDGNDFHWQWANLVLPLLAHPQQSGTLTASPEMGAIPPVSVLEPGSSRSSMHSAGLVAVPEGEDHSANRLSAADSQYSSSNSSHLPLPPLPTPSFSATSSTFDTSVDGLSMQSPRSLSTPPPSSVPRVETLDSLPRSRHQSEQGRSSPSFNAANTNTIYQASPTVSPALTPTTEAPTSGSKKWGSMFKKVSMKGIRSASSGMLPGGIGMGTAGRTFSEPGTPAEAMSAEAKSGGGGGGMFRSRLLSRTPKYTPSSSAGNLLSPSGGAASDRKARRTSYLKIGGVPALDLNLSPSDLGSAFPTAEPPDQTAALRSVMAYLRDLDDLTSEAAAPAPSTTFSPPLRHSPSLGAISPSSAATNSSTIRRAQSSRRIPRRMNSGDPPALPLSQYTDDGDASEQSTPVMNVSDSAGSGAGTKLKQDPTRRDAVIKEILDTERSYLKGLQELCEIYIGPAATAVSSSGGGKRETVVPSAERKAVFGNVEAIRDFHEKIFLPDLLDAAESKVDGDPDVAHEVARVFIAHAAFLKIYSSYVNSFDSALNRLQTWTVEPRPRTSNGGTVTVLPQDQAGVSPITSSQRKRIKSYLKRCRLHPRHSQISLESYLLLPVQRVPRYRMLLESLLSCTPRELLGGVLEPQPVIKEALDLVAGVATDMNERKRESEGRQKLLYWQQRIGNKFRSPLVQPHRSLLRSGTFTLLRAVKRASTYAEVNARTGGVATDYEPSTVVQIHSLHTETAQQNLIVLLCTDILVFLKEPADSADVTGPIDLYTVLRLTGGPGVARRNPPASLLDSKLRIALDTRAILYVQCSSRSEATSWMHAINALTV